jgi:UDP-glucose 4-epimerase
MFSNVLITGGAGFIGSHLAEELLRRGSKITILDNLSTGTWTNVDHLAKDPNCRIIIASASEVPLLEHEIPKHDLVYHLASAVGVKLIVNRPLESVETIVDTTYQVLKVCSRYRRPVLLTSTSEVYGKSPAVPFQEDGDLVMGPTSARRWLYACAKALDEFLALAHYYQTSLPVYIVRLFNTVGPRQSSQYGMVLPTFIQQALEGKPLTVYGDGNQSRCFCSVRDVVRGLLQIPLSPGTEGQVINLGSQQEVRIRELAERVISLTGSRSSIELVPYNEAYGPGFEDMTRRVPDISKAERMIGWSPRLSLDEIILNIVECKTGVAAIGAPGT